MLNIFKKTVLVVIVVIFMASCQLTPSSNNKPQPSLISDVENQITSTSQTTSESASKQETNFSPMISSTKEQNSQTPMPNNEASTTIPTITVQAETTRSPNLHPTEANNIELLSFEEKITYVGWDISPEQTFVGVFDPVTSENVFINPPEDSSDKIFGGRPLWDSNKDNLIFLDTDRSQNQLSLWITDKFGKQPQQIGQYYPRFIEDTDKSAGLFLYGWDNSNKWVAYAYTLSTVRRELNLLNTLTGKIIETPMKNLYWFQWSPNSDLYAYTDLESVYIASPETVTNPNTYSWSKFLGLVNWHPTENKILVAASDDLSTKGWTSLWELNLETETPILIGEFSNITQFNYSSGGTLIALYIYHNVDQISQLLILDDDTKEIIQKIDLPAVFFRDLKWIDEETIALNSGDNIYLLPINQSEYAEWVFGSKDPFYNILKNIQIVDW